MSEIGDIYKEMKRHRRQLSSSRSVSNLDDLVAASRKHDIGFRFINKEQGHIRVDGNVEFWLTRGKWYHAHSGARGQGVDSLIRFILDWPGRKEKDFSGQ